MNYFKVVTLHFNTLYINLLTHINESAKLRVLRALMPFEPRSVHAPRPSCDSCPTYSHASPLVPHVLLCLKVSVRIAPTFKEVIQWYHENGKNVSETAKKFSVDRKKVRIWVKNEESSRSNTKRYAKEK